jgi:ribosomal protein S18 acetylase RimI-like enzyme
MQVWVDGVFTGRKRGDIQDVWVHEDHRGHGYGQEMMAVAIAEARRMGFERLTLTSRKHRKAARHIYAKLGFEKTTDGFTLQLIEKKEEGTT